MQGIGRLRWVQCMNLVVRSRFPKDVGSGSVVRKWGRETGEGRKWEGHSDLAWLVATWNEWIIGSSIPVYGAPSGASPSAVRTSRPSVCASSR